MSKKTTNKNHLGIDVILGAAGGKFERCKTNSPDAHGE